MEKVKSLYSKLGQDKALAKATLYAQIPIFLVTNANRISGAQSHPYDSLSVYRRNEGNAGLIRYEWTA